MADPTPAQACECATWARPYGTHVLEAHHRWCSQYDARAVIAALEQRVADAVAAERESCARVCETPVALPSVGAWAQPFAVCERSARACAAAIRARGGAT